MKDIRVDFSHGVARLYVHNIELCQSANIMISFSALFEVLRRENCFPARIIEIGTCRGGLSIFLKEVAPQRFDLITYDINPYNSAYGPMPHPELFALYSIDFRLKDCFSATDEIATLIQKPGTTILLCDGGDKIKEFNTFAPYLKPGDIIMVHDYGDSVESFKRELHNLHWKEEWLSCTGKDIEESCKENRLVPYMQDLFKSSVWGIRRKA